MCGGGRCNINGLSVVFLDLLARSRIFMVVFMGFSCLVHLQPHYYTPQLCQIAYTKKQPQEFPLPDY